LDGSGEIAFAKTPNMAITKGDAVVIPFAAGAYSLTGANAIICRPPLAELALVAE
jgi:mannose-6-phosphate isomerase